MGKLVFGIAILGVEWIRFDHAPGAAKNDPMVPVGLPILFAIVVLAFLAIGAFVLCAGVPKFRAGGLGAALWFAVWGPCVIVWMLFAGLVVIANSFVADSVRSHGVAPRLPAHLTGWLVLGIMLMANSLTATAIVWLHQLIVNRMTFALFRLYATAVVAGIGSVWADMATVAWVSCEIPHPVVFWVAATIILTLTAGCLHSATRARCAASRRSVTRGSAPRSFMGRRRRVTRRSRSLLKEIEPGAKAYPGG